ncbi:MAG: thioesterase family protein [Xanthobacteraceae bacterium]
MSERVIHPPLEYDVAYADTDAGGIVYHAAYIAMAERSRNRVLCSLGIPVAGMRARFGVLFVIRAVHAEYHRPALVGDVLALTSGIVRAGPVRVVWRTAILRGTDQICDVEAQIVAFDPVSGGPCLLPSALMARLDEAPRIEGMRRVPALKMSRSREMLDAHCS